jgi:hypothetical protein
MWWQNLGAVGRIGIVAPLLWTIVIGAVMKPTDAEHRSCRRRVGEIARSVSCVFVAELRLVDFIENYPAPLGN